MKAPHLFLCVALLLAAGTPLSAAEPGKLAPTLQPFVNSSLVAGTVALVATPEKVLAHEAVGYADLTAKKPMRPDAMFWIASQTKPITGVALMILVDEKKVSVDDPVAKYLPEFADAWVKAEADGDHQLLKRPKRPVLVRDILTHTSGLPPKTAIEEPTNDILPLATRVRSYAMIPLNSEPGTKYVYSNAGINTVGRIVEVASGMPYEAFVAERIFRPLGMKDTTFWPNAEQLTRLAKAYEPASGALKERNIDQLKYPLDSRDRTAFPGGGLFSTAQDLLQFYRMLANNGVYEGRRILSAEAVRQMTSTQTPEGITNKYGFGITADGKFFGHGGAYNTNSRYDRTTGLITILLVQQSRWEKGGEKLLPDFQRAAAKAFPEAAPRPRPSEAKAP